MTKVIRKRSTTKPKKAAKKSTSDQSNKSSGDESTSTPLSKEQVDELLNNDDW